MTAELGGSAGMDEHYPKDKLRGLLGEIRGWNMEKCAAHLCITLNLFKSTELQGIPNGIEVNMPYNLFTTLQSCGGHNAVGYTAYTERHYEVYKKRLDLSGFPGSRISLPAILYQSPNNSLLEAAIEQMQLDLCVYPFMYVSSGEVKYLNAEYLKKIEEFKREGKGKLRMQLVGGGQNGAQTIVPRNCFPIYSLQKKK